MCHRDWESRTDWETRVQRAERRCWRHSRGQPVSNPKIRPTMGWNRLRDTGRNWSSLGAAGGQRLPIALPT